MSDEKTDSILPWWIRAILAVTSKEGLSYTIALVFVTGTCWVGYQMTQIMQIVASRHIAFLDSQTTQMGLQTQVMNQMTQSSISLNASNTRQESLQSEILNKMSERQEEHQQMIKALIALQKKLMAE